MTAAVACPECGTRTIAWRRDHVDDYFWCGHCGKAIDGSEFRRLAASAERKSRPVHDV